MKIVNYEEKYADQMDKIEEKYWFIKGARKNFAEGKYYKIALDKKEKVIGFIKGKKYGDLFHIDTMAIKAGSQRKGIGSALLSNLLTDKKLSDVKNFIATLIYSEEKMKL